MIGLEEGLSEDLTGRSSGWRSHGCGRVAMIGGGGNISFGKSEFLCKRTPMKGGEWMR
jgi:hypothetical protein